jgi:flavin-dependent dehydrogenase
MPFADAQPFHVAVVGGGPAGLAAALALARENLSSVVIERTEYDEPRVGEHLPPAAKARFAALGLPLGEHAPCPGVRSNWGGGAVEDKDYVFHPEGEGVNLSRPEFDRQIAARAAAAGAVIATASKVAGLARSGGRWTVEIEHGGVRRSVTAEFVIDATGRSASLAKRLGAKPRAHDDLVGIMGYAAAVGADRRVFIEAMDTGWWYSTRLKGDLVVAVFLTDPDQFDPLGAGRARAWRQRLDMAPLTGSRLAPSTIVNALHVRSARTQRLDRMHGDGWIAIGDAATSFDPLASEGIAKGLQSARSAARAIADWRRGDRLAPEAYACEAGRAFDDYLVQRRKYYAMEARWPLAPFWRRRQAQPPGGAAHGSGEESELRLGVH